MNRFAYRIKKLLDEEVEKSKVGIYDESNALHKVRLCWITHEVYLRYTGKGLKVEEMLIKWLNDKPIEELKSRFTAVYQS